MERKVNLKKAHVTIVAACLQGSLTFRFVFVLFREKLGYKVLIKTARDELSPKVRKLHVTVCGRIS